MKRQKGEAVDGSAREGTGLGPVQMDTGRCELLCPVSGRDFWLTFVGGLAHLDLEEYASIPRPLRICIAFILFLLTCL